MQGSLLAPSFPSAPEAPSMAAKQVRKLERNPSISSGPQGLPVSKTKTHRLLGQANLAWTLTGPLVQLHKPTDEETQMRRLRPGLSQSALRLCP